MDNNEFFRNATLRICGNLEIEHSLNSLLQLLKEHMPVSRLYLQYFEENLQSIRTMAIADENGFRKVDQVAHLSKESIETNKNIPADANAFLITDPEKFSVSRDMMNYHDKRGSSIIILVLRTEHEILGFLILQSTGEDKLSEEDLELAKLLVDPMLIATANALKHDDQWTGGRYCKCLHIFK